MDAVWTRIGAYALCVDDRERVLLTRFAFAGHPDDGRWTMPGGGMEWDETPRETVLRELREETGLTATIGDVAGVYSRWFTARESVRGSAGQFLGLVFFATDVRGELREAFDGLDTTDGAAWVPTADVGALPHVELVDFALGLVTGRAEHA